MLPFGKNVGVIIRDASSTFKMVEKAFWDAGYTYSDIDVRDGFDYLIQKALSEWGYVVKNNPPNTGYVTRVMANAHVTMPTILDEIVNLISGLEMYGDYEVAYVHLHGNLIAITKTRARHESRSYSHNRRCRVRT